MNSASTASISGEFSGLATRLLPGELQQHYTDVGGVEVRPAVGQLWHPRQQLPAPEFVVLISAR